MSNQLLPHNKWLWFILVIALLLVLGAAKFGLTHTQFFPERVGIGIEPSTRGEQLRVRGWTIFGEAGSKPGAITFMPPDDTGFYHIDNAGKQKLRISGGTTPGQFEYMTISDPGKVTIKGDLYIDGELFVKKVPVRVVPPDLSPIEILNKENLVEEYNQQDQSIPKSWSTSRDIQFLQFQIDSLQGKLKKVTERVNTLSK